MYRVSFSGCFIFILFCLFIMFLVKELWWLIVGIALVLIVIYYLNLIYQKISAGNIEKNNEYTPQMGEVYKICPYCNAKVKVTASTCPVCKHALN